MNPNLQLHQFVRCRDNELGVAKLVEYDVASNTARLEYFSSPAHLRHHEDVPADSLVERNLDRQTRVYHHDPASGRWRSGRVLENQIGAYLIAFPKRNREKKRIPESIACQHLFVRWERPFDDPTDDLALRVNETPHFHQYRFPLVKALVEQRAACAGMNGLLSASIQLESYQVETVRRVSQDPIQRYLLADEVGLGKTIEAGVLIRQCILDAPAHRVVVLAPDHLAGQWENELRDRLRLGSVLGKQVRVLRGGQADLAAVAPPTLLVIDEAHHITHWAAEPVESAARQRFEQVRRLALAAPRLLLLSATPVLYNRRAYQAMLHLLAPAVYPLGDLEALNLRLDSWRRLAELFAVFEPGQPNGALADDLVSLRAMFPKDARLRELADELEPHIDILAPDEGAERSRLVGGIRTHLSEAYRLHRRLIRNRRDNPAIKRHQLLPGRAGLHLQSVLDPLRRDLEELLEHWRQEALAAANTPKHTGELGGLGLFLVEAASADPRVLAELAGVRLGGAAATPGLSEPDRQRLRRPPLFPGEELLLHRIRETIARNPNDARLDALTEWLTGELSPTAEQNWIVFATYPGTADRVYRRLQDATGRAYRHGRRLDAWQGFLQASGGQVLVCDRQAEDGLNLQGRSMVVCHFDLPFAPSRIEQRLGRCDRYNQVNGAAVPSWSLRTEEARWEGGWLRVLDEGYGIFRRSVASLQYLIEQETRTLAEGFLDHGAAVLDAARTRLAGPRGLVEEQLRTIARVDELDCAGLEADGTAFCTALKTAESRGWVGWRTALEKWLDEVVQFPGDLARIADAKLRHYHYQTVRGSHETLMPSSRVEALFPGVLLDLAGHEVPPGQVAGRYTYPLAYGRTQAVQRGTALARIGDSFVDAVATDLRWDDRGACFALWRWRVGQGLPAQGNPPWEAFRFDFVIEANTRGAEEALAGQSWVTAPALRRLLDELFPPLHASVWIDDNLTRITDAARLSLLEEGYQDALVVGRGMDFNLNRDRWEPVSRLPGWSAAEWAGRCREARAAARQLVGEAVGLPGLVAERSKAAQQRLEASEGHLQAYIAHLPTAQREAEQAEFDRYQRWMRAVIAGIEGLTGPNGHNDPAIRIDAAGAILLAGWTPFSWVPD